MGSGTSKQENNNTSKQENNNNSPTNSAAQLKTRLDKIDFFTDENEMVALIKDLNGTEIKEINNLLRYYSFAYQDHSAQKIFLEFLDKKLGWLTLDLLNVNNYNDQELKIFGLGLKFFDFPKVLFINVEKNFEIFINLLRNCKNNTYITELEISESKFEKEEEIRALIAELPNLKNINTLTITNTRITNSQILDLLFMAIRDNGSITSLDWTLEDAFEISSTQSNTLSFDTARPERVDAVFSGIRKAGIRKCWLSSKTFFDLHPELKNKILESLKESNIVYFHIPTQNNETQASISEILEQNKLRAASSKKMLQLTRTVLITKPASPENKDTLTQNGNPSPMTETQKEETISSLFQQNSSSFWESNETDSESEEEMMSLKEFDKEQNSQKDGKEEETDLSPC